MAFKITRRFTALTPKETDEVVKATATLVVNYLAKAKQDGKPSSHRKESTHERIRIQGQIAD